MNRFLTIACLLLGFAASAQEDVNPDFHGNWANLDGEILTINVDNTFIRRSATEIKATGVLSMVDNQLRVTRTDSEQEYELMYYAGDFTLVITKPGSQEAWVFQRMD